MLKLTRAAAVFVGVVALAVAAAWPSAYAATDCDSPTALTTQSCPTATPTAEPTTGPTGEPTAGPTTEPTAEPTSDPTGSPSTPAPATSAPGTGGGDQDTPPGSELPVTGTAVGVAAIVGAGLVAIGLVLLHFRRRRTRFVA